MRVVIVVALKSQLTLLVGHLSNSVKKHAMDANAAQCIMRVTDTAQLLQ